MEELPTNATGYYFANFCSGFFKMVLEEYRKGFRYMCDLVEYHCLYDTNLL